MTDKKDRNRDTGKGDRAKQDTDRPSRDKGGQFNESEKRRRSILDTIPPPDRKKNDK